MKRACRTNRESLCEGRGRRRLGAERILDANRLISALASQLRESVKWSAFSCAPSTRRGTKAQIAPVDFRGAVGDTACDEALHSLPLSVSSPFPSPGMRHAGTSTLGETRCGRRSRFSSSSAFLVYFGGARVCVPAERRSRRGVCGRAASSQRDRATQNRISFSAARRFRILRSFLYPHSHYSRFPVRLVLLFSIYFLFRPSFTFGAVAFVLRASSGSARSSPKQTSSASSVSSILSLGADRSKCSLEISEYREPRSYRSARQAPEKSH